MVILILEYAAIGILAGLAAGIFGVGGGTIIVPALTLLFSHQASIIPADNMMHFVVGTSLASFIVSTTFALRAQLRRGTVDIPLFKLLAPGIIIGTIAGALFSSMLNTDAIKITFGVFMLTIAFHMFLNFKPSSHFKLSQTKRWTGSLFIGTASGLLGIGTGTLMTPWLNYHNTPLHRAIALSTSFGVVVALTGTISYILTGWNPPSAPPWSTGYIYWPAVLAITIFSPVFANLGVIIAHKLSAKALKNIFAVYVFLVGVRMLF